MARSFLGGEFAGGEVTAYPLKDVDVLQTSNIASLPIFTSLTKPEFLRN